jgi:uncharacterized protein (TIRG00374 family)
MQKKRIILLTLGLIIFLSIIFKTLSIKDISILITTKNLIVIILVALFINIIIPIKTFRWKYLLKANKIKNITFNQSFIEIGSSFFLGSITPGRLGEFSRVLSSKNKKKELTAIFIIEYLTDLIAILGIPLIFSLIILYKIQFVSIIVGIIFGILILGYLFLKMNIIDTLFTKVFPKHNSIIQKKKEILKIFQSYIKNYKAIIVSILIAFIMYMILYTIGWIILITIGINISFSTAIAIYSIGQLIGIISFIPQGLGSREAAIFGFLISLGYESTLITSSLLILRIITIIPILICYPIYIKFINQKFS